MAYTIKKFTELKDTSEVRIEVTLPPEEFASYRTKALHKLGKVVKLDGFRKGKAPEAVLLKHIGEGGVLEEAANLAIADVYPQVLREKELLIIDAPMVTITTLASGELLAFTLQAPVPPVFKLPNYTKLATKHLASAGAPEVTDEEVHNALVGIRRQRKYIELIESKVAPEKAATEADTTKEEELPELDEGFLKLLGDFESADAFTAEVRTNILHEKEAHERNKRRAALLDALVADTTIPLPPVLVAHELDRLQAQFEADLTRVGSTLNAYLKSVNKTAEHFLEELKPQAEKQAKLQLILNKIAEEEKLVPEEATVEHEAAHLLEHHKDADPRAARAYVTMQLCNQMVLEKLEEIAA